MIKKFICWFWGHKYTGGLFFERINEPNKTGFSIYRFGQKRCTRCGAKAMGEL